MSLSTLTVRPMQEADLPIVMAIEQLSMSLAWSQAVWLEELKKIQLANHVVAETEEPTIVGYAGFWLVLDEANVVNIAVHPEWRRKGVGKFLVREVLSMAKARGARLVTLEVRVSNEAALALYRRLGFDIIAMRKRFYQKPEEDAYVLWLNPIVF